MAKDVYKIVVSLEPEGGPGTAPTTDSKTPKAKNEPSRYEKFQSGAAKGIAYAGTALKVVSFATSLNMQRLNIVTGQTQLAQKRQAVISMSNDLLGLGSSMVTGGVIASAFGIAGPAGLAVGAIGFVGQKAIDVGMKYNEIYLKNYVEDEQLHILRNRAGASFNRSRLNN